MLIFSHRGNCMKLSCPLFPVSYPTYPDNFMKIHSHIFSVIFTKKHRSTEKNIHASEGMHARSSKYFQIVACGISDLCWKFHENPFINFPVMLLRVTPPRLAWGPWNSIIRHETVQANISCTILWKFDEDPFRSLSAIFLDKPGTRKKILYPQNVSYCFVCVVLYIMKISPKKNHIRIPPPPPPPPPPKFCIQGVKRKTPQFSRLFLVWCPNYSENFMRIRSSGFP